MLYNFLVLEINIIAFRVFFFLKFWSFDVKIITYVRWHTVYPRPNNFCYFHIGLS